MRARLLTARVLQTRTVLHNGATTLLRTLLADVLNDHAAADASEAAFDQFFAWLRHNMPASEADAARLKCRHLNVYDTFLEWILLDAFEDLENLPSALQVRQRLRSRWLTAGRTCCTGRRRRPSTL